MRDGAEEGFVTKTNMERITNGIFAFTMTLLARNIAMLWFLLYQIYRNITAVDRHFAHFLMFFLIILVFTPFANQIDNAYRNPSASAILQATLAILGVICFLLWRYASRAPGIINPGITRARIRFQTLKFCVIPVLSLIALGIPVGLSLGGQNLSPCTRHFPDRIQGKRGRPGE